MPHDLITRLGKVPETFNPLWKNVAAIVTTTAIDYRVPGRWMSLFRHRITGCVMLVNQLNPVLYDRIENRMFFRVGLDYRYTVMGRIVEQVELRT